MPHFVCLLRLMCPSDKRVDLEVTVRHPNTHQTMTCRYCVYASTVNSRYLCVMYGVATFNDSHSRLKLAFVGTP